MPFIDTGAIIGATLGTLRSLDINNSVIGIFNKSLADFLSDSLQRGLLRTLVRDEEYISLIEGIDRLDRDVIRISGANADDKNFSHPFLLIQTGVSS